MPVAAIAAAMGGNVRVGLEDSLWIGPGQLAKSNAEQVTRARQIIEGLGLEIAKPDEAGLRILHDASDAMMLSARGYHRVLRVARTLADLDGEDRIGRLHIVEALSYRQKLAAFRQAA